MAKTKKVNFNKQRIVRLYKGGHSVYEIAQAIGYAAGKGNNRVRNFLKSAKLYRKPRAKKAA